MYCSRCNAYNDDNARFCNNCGMELTAPQNEYRQEQPNYQEAAGNVPPQENFNNNFNQNANGNQTPNSAPFNSPYGQPMYHSAPVRYSNTMPIIAIVASIINFNILGIVFAFISLAKYNKQEEAARMGNFLAASEFGKSSRTYSIVSLVISIVSIIACAILIPLFFFIFANAYADTAEYFEVPYFGEEAYMMISNAFAMLKGLL